MPASPVIDAAIDKLEVMLGGLRSALPESIHELRLVEAQAAYAYFAAWQMLPLRWKGTGRKPIPPEWHHVVARPSMVSSRNRHATHPINAMLNYAYAVLESQVRIAIVSQGLDPTIGYLHASRPERVALVYDLMEPMRPWADRLILAFVLSRSFAPSDFVLTTSGVCRLHPQLAKKAAQLIINDGVVDETMSLMKAELSSTMKSLQRQR